MKYLAFLFVSVCFVLNAQSQLTGRVVDSAGNVLHGATVMLLKAGDGSLARAVSTNDSGVFVFPKSIDGKFFLRVSMMGFDSLSSDSFEWRDGQVKDAGVFKLKSSVSMLKDVIVRAGKSVVQQWSDGIVVNVESSLISKGSTALQLLERSPGVQVDLRNGEIMLNGKSGVVVMIDEKIIRMQADQLISFLNNMPADNIERIELLNTPSAKYDADGNAGIIHIVLKKSHKKGTNAALSFTGGHGMGSKAVAQGSLSHSNSKWWFNGSYSFSRNNTYSDLFITGKQDMPVFGGPLHVTVWDTTKARNTSHDLNLNLELMPYTTTRIGVALTLGDSRSASTTKDRSDYNILPDSQLFFRSQVNAINQWKSLLSSLYADKTFNKNQRISASADYLLFKNDFPTTIDNSFKQPDGTAAGDSSLRFSPKQKGFAFTTIHVAIGKIDYRKMFNKNSTIEAGAKFTATKASSSSGIEGWSNGNWLNRPETNNFGMMDERISAVYAMHHWQPAEGHELVTGLRYEYALMIMRDKQTGKKLQERKRGWLFPNIFYTRKTEHDAEWQLSYSKRISRPAYNDLASFMRYADAVAVFTGNTFLQPTVTHNIKVGYSKKGYAVSLLYSRDDNPIIRYQISKSASGEILLVGPQNLAWQNNVQAQFTVPVKVNNWWQMNYGVITGLRSYKIVHTPVPASKTYIGFSGNFNEQFLLPRNYTIELSGWYNSTNFNGSIKNRWVASFNAGIKKTLNKNFGSLQFSVTDIFTSQHYNNYYGAATKEVFDITNHVQFTPESGRMPIFRLSYTKSFGFASRSAGRKEGSIDEKNRIIKE